MSKVILRLIVIIAVVVVSVAITTAIVYKPNYNQVIYNQWESMQDNSRYDLQKNINKKINSIDAHYNDRTLIECETKILNVSKIAKGIDEYLEYLVKQSKNSKFANEENIANVKSKLDEFYKNRFSDDGVGYWVDYYYQYVQNKNFNAHNTQTYNDIVNCIITKWIENEKLGAEGVTLLETYVSECVFEDENVDLKNILLNYRAEFSALFFNAENYTAFETKHLNEYNNLLNNINSKLNNTLINYSENDLKLSNSYFSISKETLRNFLQSEDKANFVNSQSDEKIKSTLNILNSYLGSN